MLSGPGLLPGFNCLIACSHSSGVIGDSRDVEISSEILSGENCSKKVFISLCLLDRSIGGEFVVFREYREV